MANTIEDCSRYRSVQLVQLCEHKQSLNQFQLFFDSAFVTYKFFVGFVSGTSIKSGLRFLVGDPIGVVGLALSVDFSGF